MRSHLLDNPNLLHEQAGAFALQPEAPAVCHAEILTRAPAADHIHRDQFRALQLHDVADREHIRKPYFCNFHRKRLDLAGPYRSEPLPDACQRKSADPVKQAAEGQRCGHSRSSIPKEGASCGIASISFGKYSTVRLTGPIRPFSRSASTTASS
ncbi:hypothetical protein SDC9_49837 [bioreactor metagenome]|uniref:Uncharacterized protein n=1 Tax=bioreactor metagenome TaxID=1076179 RepID=A0A644WIL0_9ZZZZ